MAVAAERLGPGDRVVVPPISSDEAQFTTSMVIATKAANLRIASPATSSRDRSPRIPPVYLASTGSRSGPSRLATSSKRGDPSEGFIGAGAARPREPRQAAEEHEHGDREPRSPDERTPDRTALRSQPRVEDDHDPD